MQQIYIARMLHRSLDLFVGAPRILRNLRQPALIRWYILVSGVTHPDLKIPSYNEGRIVNTRGPRQRTDPWPTFGITSQFVQMLSEVCLCRNSMVATCLGLLSSIRRKLVHLPVYRLAILTTKLRVQRFCFELGPFNAYG